MTSQPGVNRRIFSAITAFSDTLAPAAFRRSCSIFTRRCRRLRSSLCRSLLPTARLPLLDLIPKTTPRRAGHRQYGICNTILFQRQRRDGEPELSYVRSFATFTGFEKAFFIVRQGGGRARIDRSPFFPCQLSLGGPAPVLVLGSLTTSLGSRRRRCEQ